jgi:hypothetical protein
MPNRPARLRSIIPLVGSPTTPTHFALPVVRTQVEGKARFRPAQGIAHCLGTWAFGRRWTAATSKFGGGNEDGQPLARDTNPLPNLGLG